MRGTAVNFHNLPKQAVRTKLSVYSGEIFISKYTVPRPVAYPALFFGAAHQPARNQVLIKNIVIYLRLAFIQYFRCYHRHRSFRDNRTCTIFQSSNRLHLRPNGHVTSGIDLTEVLQQSLQLQRHSLFRIEGLPVQKRLS